MPRPEHPAATSSFCGWFRPIVTPGFDRRRQLRDNVVVKTAASPTLADRRTRERVTRLLLELGPSTAAALGERLGLTPAAVRRHLDAMLAAGTLVARDAPVRGPRGRGRPARLFALSDAGHAAGPTSYDDVALSALRYLRDTAGEDAVEDFARQRIAGWEARYAGKIASLPLDERPAALAEALCDDGYAATVHEGANLPEVSGVQVCQHHCPVQHVAEEFPALCEAETEAIGRLVGRHVQRLATIAHGDGVCTTHIPLTPVTPSLSERTSS
jgi:predicted ArsR family transcriptional regulator